MDTPALERPEGARTMTEFTIEKNVPIPVGGKGVSGQTKYPFSEMKIGDSFAVSCVPSTVISAARNWRNTHNSSCKFSVRKTPDGCRCWRVA